MFLARLLHKRSRSHMLRKLPHLLGTIQLLCQLLYHLLQTIYLSLAVGLVHPFTGLLQKQQLQSDGCQVDMLKLLGAATTSVGLEPQLLGQACVTNQPITSPIRNTCGWRTLLE